MPIFGQIWSFLGNCSFPAVRGSPGVCGQVVLVVFCYVGNKTFDFSSKKRIFCPKTTKFGPKLAFLVNLGQAMQAYSVPCWWVGWWLWRVGCISQDTYLLYRNATTITKVTVVLSQGWLEKSAKMREDAQNRICEIKKEISI